MYKCVYIQYIHGILAGELGRQGGSQQGDIGEGASHTHGNARMERWLVSGERRPRRFRRLPSGFMKQGFLYRIYGDDF